MCSEVAVRSFLCLNGTVNSHLNSFILITTALVLSTNPQRIVHRYPTGSSSCTIEATVSLIIHFPQRNFLYFVFCNFILYFVLSMLFAVTTACLLGREQKQSWKCLDTGGQAASALAMGLAEVRVQSGKISLHLVIQRRWIACVRLTPP